MKILDFYRAFDRLLGNEGGYVNNPKDPGGETNWGISKRSYPDLDIAGLTREDAKLIYKRDFWDEIEADELPSSVVYQLFDFAVNSGIETAIRYFQRAIGVADDGYWGPHSKEVANSWTESDLVMAIIAERLDFMSRLRNWPDAGRGWARRIVKQLKFAIEDTD